MLCVCRDGLPDDPVVADLHLPGEWTIERTPGQRIPGHRTDAFGERYAYDLIRTDDRPGFTCIQRGTVRWYLMGGRTRDCYGWGQPVHAASNDLEALDGVPERR